MDIQLSDHFTYPRLIRFVIPSIAMMIFTSIYYVVDGFFVSNFAGATSFAAINLSMPFVMLVSCLGFMIGTGGTAIVSKTMGEGKAQLAKEYFSLLIYTAIALGAFLTLLGILCMEPVCRLLGADGDLLRLSVLYGRLVLISTIPFMLTACFQSFLVAAERPNIGFYVTVAAGILNMVLDLVFVGFLRWGIVGAAAATVTSETIGGLIPLIYFILPNESPLGLGPTHFRLRVLIQTCINGSSELVSNISMSVIGMLYNFQLMRLAGEGGVAAYGIMMYVGYIFVAVYIGYAMGTSPIISYHYGAANHGEMRNVFTKSLKIIAVCGILITSMAQIFARPLAGIFVSYDQELWDMTVQGIHIYMMAFLISGFNIYASSFFTALGNGLISALISFLRSIAFESVCVLVLPYFLGINGVWASMLSADAMALVLSACFLYRNRKRYGYL